MGFFDNLLSKVSADFSKYAGDKVFLSAAVGAAALVVNADGQIDDAEVNAAIAGLSANKKLNSAYKPAEIESELVKALNDSKTRSGKLNITRALEALVARPVEQRQDVLVIAADVADQGGIGQEEKDVLINIGKSVGLDAVKFLGL